MFKNVWFYVIAGAALGAGFFAGMMFQTNKLKKLNPTLITK